MKRGVFLFALWMAKLSVIALKLTGHKGTDFPGTLALKICPGFLGYIGKPPEIIAVTGTNGKTTVNNLINDALVLDGKRVVNNDAGSNLDSGIATALIRNSTVFGRCKCEIGSFEVDERSSRTVYPYLIPDIILITNLSRDSIMRNGHPEYISSILTRYIPKTSKLVLNGDDLISVMTAPDNDRVYFGLEKTDLDKKEPDGLINDCRICPGCSSKLEYEYVRYGHIGRAYCSKCGFHGPDYDYSCRDIDLKNMTADIADREGVGTYRILNDSIYNIYNVTAVIALLRELGYEIDKIKGFLEDMQIVGTRLDEEKVLDKRIIMMLAKDRNAFGTSRVFDYISGQPQDKEIILMNNNYSDEKNWSENTCWLYDCDFELLARDNIKNIIVTGPRGKDQKLRLLLAGVQPERISYSEKEADAPGHLQLFTDEDIYILYGTDNISLGKQVAEKTKAVIYSKEGGKQA